MCGESLWFEKVREGQVKRKEKATEKDRRKLWGESHPLELVEGG